MQIDIARADRVLTRLGELLRASLGAGDSNTVPLQAELHLVRLYAEIMQERFFGRVTLDWQIAENTMDVQVPAMLLQPFLENAFKYGIEQTTSIEAIGVTVIRERALLIVKIRNTGSALQPGWRDGLGIANSRERLRVLYGAAAALDIANDPQGGVVVSLSLPANGANR
jgi:LytS/YehU family sensor histidine kinase